MTGVASRPKVKMKISRRGIMKIISDQFRKAHEMIAE
jgi:hypothetical protein